MDGFQLFKKLVVGAKFDFKRFHNDAERLKIVSPICTQQDKTKLPDVAKDKQVIEVHAAKTQHITTSEESSSKKRKSTLQEHKKPKKIKKDEPEDTSSDDNGQVDTSNADDSNSEDSDDDDVQNQQTVSELQILGNITSSGDITSQTSKRLKKKTKKKTSTKLADLKQEEINHLRNVSKIHTYGYDIPDPVSSFTQLQSEYDLHPTLIENIQSVGYSTPTSIQMQAVPVMLLRRDLMACAPTGSGKTAAFIIPILHHLKEPRNLGFRALILAPTRELAKQTTREFQRLAEGRGFRIYYMDKASTAIKKFGPKAKRKFDILVTTPNRLVYLLNQSPPVISLNSIEWLVVDESDKLFEEGKTGFRDQLAEIYKACDSGNVRRAMFSATFAYEVEEWCKLNLDNVVQVYVGARNSATENIEQELVFVGTESGKLLAMRNLIQKGIQPPVLIFVQSKERAKELFHELIYEGISVDVMHADRTQLQRDNIVKCFRCGKIWVLICTELMGRGMDFKGINLVINYDFPNSAISYIHRIGRTGRAGHTGKAITFFTDDDTVNLRSIANVMKEAGCPVPDYMLHMKPPDKKTRKHLSHSKKIRDRISTTPLQDLQKQNWKKKLNKDVKRKQKMSHGQLKTKKTFEKTKNTSSKILSTSKHNESKAVKKMKHQGNLKNKAQKSR